MAHKSKILIIGGTGYIGKYIIEEIAKAGHPTFALVRENTASNPENSKLIKSFKSFGVTLLYGDIYHHERLVKAIKQVDVVICAFGSPEQIADQRFFPSDFRTDFDRVHAVEPAAHFFGVKATIFVKEEDIATYTIKAVDDPRTLNKIVHLRPPENIFPSMRLSPYGKRRLARPLRRLIF
ncbi:isoflavone reductase like protein a622-like [Quercus suber]|uniref:Isoflavone reductase like protein a622-like n=1 Tax=Quercus suber TaxID=58331 RepID=A0AAW0JJT9_QUESU